MAIFRYDAKYTFTQKHFMQLSLAFGSLGIERETLRCDESGKLATTSHPHTLGSAYTHPHITTDYAETLLEIVTDPETTPAAAYNSLLRWHQFVAQNIGTEKLWPASMPCILPDNPEQTIEIGYYGTSNGGKMRRLYREGLAVRYGKAMQMIAGIHFNYSPPTELWAELAARDEEDLNQDYINHRYMGALRTINRYAWLINYLYGASPAVDQSFLPAHGVLTPFSDGQTLGWKSATSLRMSELGYQNKTQFSVSFNDIETYVRDLARAVSTPAPRFEHIGLYREDGTRQQISTHILQIANEYYTAARPKQLVQNNELPVIALKERGIRYLELRLLDCNPEDACGVSLEQLYFLETFMLWAILNPSPAENHGIRDDNTHNRLRVACCGLKDNFTLKRLGLDYPIMESTQSLLQQMLPIAKRLDQEREERNASASIERLLQELSHHHLLPQRVQSQLELQSFIDYGKSWQMIHEKTLHMPLIQADGLREMATQSLLRQKEIDSLPQEDFETYLHKHFHPLQRILHKI